MLTPSSRRTVADRAAARVGTTVAEKYRITRLLGVGGMAAVYAAKHRNGHRVAIKVLLEHLSDDSDMRELFSREAYAANRVGHPGAVPVLDDDEDEEGYAFLIMPLLEGETLRTRWERSGKRLPLAEVGVMLADALEVLGSAHTHGVVHRDIKPENLFATVEGQLRVLDFGIARRIDAELSATLTTRVMGTPAFVPPEQALGDRRAIGPRSDLWAVGATMFTLLSGKFVHQADSANAQIAAAATRHARSLKEVMPEAPPAVVKFVDKALEFAPEDRWQSAQEMRDGLMFAVEEVLGEPFAVTAGRVRAALMTELPLISAALQGDLVETTRTVDPAPRISSGTPVRGSRGEQARGDRGEQGKARGDGGGHTVMDGVAGEPRGKARRFGGMLLQGLLVFALGGAVVTGVYRAVERPATDAAHAAPADTLSQIYAGKPEAVALLKIGIQNLRDASKGAAMLSFAKALEVDPNLAAAHLYSAMIPVWPDEVTRAHHHAATMLRDSLSPRDRALLDGYAPAMAIPLDLEACEQRLVAARAAFPSDWLVLWAVAETYIKWGKMSKAQEVLDDLLKIDPDLALAWREKGATYGVLDDQKNARAALNECLRISSYGQSCLELLMFLESNEGRCTESEKYARAMMAGPSPSSRAARYLAQSIQGRGGPIESVRDVLDRAWQLAPASARESERQEDSAHFAVLIGDFANLERTLDAWTESIADVRYEDDHEKVFRIRASAAMELDDPKRAARLAIDYTAKRDAWLRSSYLDFEIEPFRIQYITGALPRDEFAAHREAWLAHAATGPQLLEAANLRWANGYALAVATREDAVEALRVLPRYLPIVDAFYRDVDTDLGIGRTYLLAGEASSALPYLRRAAHACRAVQYPFEETWANLELGKALEETGDVAGACAAYQVVVGRWGKEPRSTSAKVARARESALRCTQAAP